MGQKRQESSRQFWKRAVSRERAALPFQRVAVLAVLAVCTRRHLRGLSELLYMQLAAGSLASLSSAETLTAHATRPCVFWKLEDQVKAPSKHRRRTPSEGTETTGPSRITREGSPSRPQAPKLAVFGVAAALAEREREAGGGLDCAA